MAMSLGVVINEVLNNAIKYHNGKQKCHIKLSFKRDKQKMTLTIEDDGEGFDIDKESRGFGLKMIREFASNLESYTIDYSFEHGTKFILSFDLKD